MNSITMQLQADKLIRMALEEDITSEDVSTNAVMPTKVQGTVDLIAKEDGVIAGMDVYARVFKLLDEDTEIEMFCHDGDEVREGDLMAKVTGDIRVLLSGERVALNYLQRMSGIATYTSNVAKLLEGSKTKLLDTRKTTPNMRIFEKYAVRVGGGFNHRYNLSDGVLLKDNHRSGRKRDKGRADGKRVRAICTEDRGGSGESRYGKRSGGSRSGHYHARQYVHGRDAGSDPHH